MAELLHKVQDFAQGLKETIPAMVKGIVEKLLFVVAQKIGTALATKIVALLNPAGILWQVIKTLYNAIVFVFKNLDKIKQLFAGIQKGFQQAISGVDPAAIATTVENFLKDAIVPAMDALARLADLGDVPADIRMVLKSVKDLAQKPVVVLLAALAKPLRAVFDQVLRALGLGAEKPEPLIRPVRFGKKQDKKLWVDHHGEVWMAASAKKKVKQYLQEQKQQAGAEKKAKVEDAERTTDQLTREAQQLTAAVQAKGSPAQTKQVPASTDKTTKTLAALAKKLEFDECPVGGSACFVAATAVALPEGEAAIETLEDGRQRVVTDGPAAPEPRPGLDQRYGREQLRRVRLVLTAGEVVLHATLIRSVEWLAAQRATPGATLWLDLPHVGVRGEALVTAVEPCPVLKQGPGRLVTGTFHFSRAAVLDLTVEGEAQPLGVTPRHPIRSADRNAWVPAGDLRVGERLVGREGRTPRVLAVALRAAPEPVYNIEVDGDHCYRVGRQGLLVHNQSYIGPGCDPCAGLPIQYGVSVPGTGGRTYIADVEGFPITSPYQDRKTCRVWKFEGPIVGTPANHPQRANAATLSRELIFGPATGPRTPQQTQLAGNYEAGHLIADSLGGPGRTENFVPMVSAFQNNPGAWYDTEQYVRGCLSAPPGATPKATSGRMLVEQTYNTNAPGIWAYIPQTIKITVTLTLSAGGTVTRDHTFRNRTGVGRPPWVRFNQLCP